MGLLVAGQSRPELTSSISNAVSPFSAHSEAGWGLQTNKSSLKSMEIIGILNGPPVDHLEETSKFKVKSRKASSGPVGDGGRLHQEAVAGPQEGSSTVCHRNVAPGFVNRPFRNS